MSAAEKTLRSRVIRSDQEPIPVPSGYDDYEQDLENYSAAVKEWKQKGKAMEVSPYEEGELAEIEARDTKFRQNSEKNIAEKEKTTKGLLGYFRKLREKRRADRLEKQKREELKQRIAQKTEERRREKSRAEKNLFREKPAVERPAPPREEINDQDFQSAAPAESVMMSKSSGTRELERINKDRSKTKGRPLIPIDNSNPFE